MKKYWISLIFTILPFITNAQCAMCRAQVSNNVSSGDMTLAQGLNYGIMYLFFTPYVVLGVVAFFWFRQSRRNGSGNGLVIGHQG